MTTRPHIHSWFYKIMIVTATIIWGLSFVVMKDTVEVMQPAYLIGWRFLLTAILLTAVFFPHMRKALTKEYLVMGIIIGLLNFLAFWIQTIGLVYTTPGKNAFLTGTYCVMVPFVYWLVARRRPRLHNVFAAVLCVAGIGFVSLGGESFSVNFGDMMTLLCALFFSFHIVYVSKFSEGRDVLALTVYQFWVGGISGLVMGFFTEQPPQLAAITPDFLWNMAYLVIFSSCVALVFQNIGIAHVSASSAALLLSLESVFGVAFSVLLYGEELTLSLIVGFALIFIAIVVSEVFPERPSRPETLDGVIEETYEGESLAARPARELPLAGDQTSGLLVIEPSPNADELSSDLPVSAK